MPAERQYAALISYSHRDERWARWLQRTVENFRVPARLQGTRGAHGPVPGRLRPVFRDRDELAAAADLSEKIQTALRNSRFLLVVCSPAAARSPWVAEEVLRFKRLGGESRILCLIVDGEPGSGGDEECYPEPLRFCLDERGELSDRPAEPIGADVRHGKDGKSLARLKLLAGMLGVDLDDLRQREQQRKHRNLLYVACASLAGMLFTGWLAWTALQARDDAERRQAQAEDLVDYMLNDLHSELRSVGRLDAMSATARKAMSYFAALDPRDLTDQALQGRAEALRQIGNIHRTQFEYDDATAAFAEAHRMDSELLARAPLDPQRRFNIGQSEFWLGYVRYEKADYSAAVEHMMRYLDISQALLDKNPQNVDWLLELSYAHNNLAAVFVETGESDRALEHIENTVRLTRLAVARAPDDDDLQFELAASLAWMGTVQRSNGLLEASAANRRASREQYQVLLERDPGNAELKDELTYSWRGEGLALSLLGRVEESLAAYRHAISGFDDLIEIDPGNARWTRDRMETLSELLRAELAADRSEFAEVDTLLAALENVRSLHKEEVASPQRRGRQMLASALAGHALLARDRADGQQRLREALEGLRELKAAAGGDTDLHLWLLESALLGIGSGQSPNESELKRITENFALHADSTRNPLYLSALARAWFALEEPERARSIVPRLLATGYRSARFERECRQVGVCPVP